MEGRRDYAFMLVAIQTGLRASELLDLNCGHISGHGLLAVLTGAVVLGLLERQFRTVVALVAVFSRDRLRCERAAKVLKILLRRKHKSAGRNAASLRRGERRCVATTGLVNKSTSGLTFVAQRSRD